MNTSATYRAPRGKDRAVAIPTVQKLQARQRQTQQALYLSIPLQALGPALQVGVDAAFLYLVLFTARRMAGTTNWFTIPSAFVEAIAKDRRWWYRHAEVLADASLIEIARQRGRLPRYRLMEFG